MGRRCFPDDRSLATFDLTGTEAFDHGVVALAYELTRTAARAWCIYRDRVPLFRRDRAGDADASTRDHERERQALDIHDNIVQGLAEAQLAFDVGRPEQAREAVERTLAEARRIVTELMGEPGPGDLRRSSPADQ